VLMASHLTPAKAEVRIEKSASSTESPKRRRKVATTAGRRISADKADLPLRKFDKAGLEGVIGSMDALPCWFWR
jgi:hypothetical protein